MERPELRDQANLTLGSVAKEVEMRAVASAMDNRERIKLEFYKTYDVMTGVRIAATLGGFFSMMILLVLYKNYCKPSKTLSEEQLNAAVTAAVEEEDRALKAALEATSFYTSLSKQRQSMTNESAVIMSPRFSSVGGGCSHLAPPMRFSYLQQRGKSLPGSALRFTLEEGLGKCGKDVDCSAEEDEKEFDAECQLPDYFANCNYLSVPPDRRLSSITCSSADSSYLERRGSAFEMGLPAPPSSVRNGVDAQKVDEEGPWDFYYPIDIQVIQPTPEISPAVSAETLCEKPMTASGLQVPGFYERVHRLSVDNSEMGLAPLASISSLTSFSSQTPTIQGNSDSNGNNGSQRFNGNSNDESVGSDSVFMDEEVGTEDEVEEFSTDSEFDYGGFDDDYSFCESSKRPMSRCQKRSLQFASFDSYDASIGQDTLSEDADNVKSVEDKPIVRKQSSVDARCQSGNPDGSRVKRKLSKTHSEPRSQKVPKQLPPWIDKGRSGYIPTRQLSVPASRRKASCRESARGRPTEARTKDPQCLQSGATPEVSNPLTSTSDSNTPASDAGAATLSSSATPQGLHKDMPSKKSLQKQDEKRKRFQKQKTVREEWGAGPVDGSSLQAKGTLLTPEDGALLHPSHDRVKCGSLRGHCNALRLPQINVQKGSCERLNILATNDDGKDILMAEPSAEDEI